MFGSGLACSISRLFGQRQFAAVQDHLHLVWDVRTLCSSPVIGPGVLVSSCRVEDGSEILCHHCGAESFRGEELTLDQGTWNFEDAGYTDNEDPCSCGAKDCRHNLTENDWKLPNVQERYKGHFHPMIQKMISNPKS
jgi:hypothetical protein